MFANQTIFRPVYSKGMSYSGVTFDGDSFQKYASAHIGVVVGEKQEMNAVMTDDVQELDQWYVFNIVDSQNIFIHAVAVLGVVASDRAEYLAQRYFGETVKTNTRAIFVGEFTHSTLKRYLDTIIPDGGRIRIEDMERVSTMATTKKVVWQDSDLISHAGSVQNLLFDMSKNDDELLLLDSMDRDDFAQFVRQLSNDSIMLDALIVENKKFPQMVNRLFIQLQKFSNDDVKIENVTQSEPFKKDGAVNIAVMLEFNDGQTLAIVFHNNDTTPAKLELTDILTSWKFVLNKRDVTAVLQPESGKGGAMDILAKRIMQVVSKNSAKFKKNNAKKEQDAQRLAELQKEVEDKQALISELAQKQKDLIERKDSLIHRHLDGGK